MDSHHQLFAGLPAHPIPDLPVLAPERGGSRPKLPSAAHEISAVWYLESTLQRMREDRASVWACVTTECPRTRRGRLARHRCTMPPEIGTRGTTLNFACGHNLGYATIV